MAKIQQTYVFFVKSGLVEAATPYDGLIPSKDRIVHYRVAGEGFKIWDNLATVETNIGSMIKSMEVAVGLDYKNKRAALEEDFYGILGVRNVSFGHAMAIRHVSKSNEVHFFDPN